MQTIEVCKGTVYAITSPAGCTVTNAAGNVLATVDAGVQKAVVATDAQLNVSDDTATITQVFGTSSSGIGGYTLTAEDVQEVVPIDWTPMDEALGLPSAADGYTKNMALGWGASVRVDNAVAVGTKATAYQMAVALGSSSSAGSIYTIAVGSHSSASGLYATTVGASSRANIAAVALGYSANSTPQGVTIGSKFTETVDGTNVIRTCTTEGTGSITIGAGANTLNTTAEDGTVTESSNAVTIGCKAENKGADSVIIGADVNSAGAGSICIGAGSKNYSQGSAGVNAIVIGSSALAYNGSSVTVGPQTETRGYSDIAIGFKAKTSGPHNGIAIGTGALCGNTNSIAIGMEPRATAAMAISIGSRTKASAFNTVAIGVTATASASQATALGYATTASAPNALTFGAQFDEVVDEVTTTYPCTTEGTGSITIGAGAVTKNTTTTGSDGTETTVESSNAITIGHKASNTTPDTIVIGAGAKSGQYGGDVIIGTAASVSDLPGNGTSRVAIGKAARAEYNSTVIGGDALGSGFYTVAIGNQAKIGGSRCVGIGGAAYTHMHDCVAIGYKADARCGSIAIGSHASAKSSYEIKGANLVIGYAATAAETAKYAIGIGHNVKIADNGAVAFRSTAEDGTITQLYFSGANTPLAVTYEGGEAMMGYVVQQKDADGNYQTVAAGTNKLSALFPNNSNFAPATMALDDEEGTTPMIFHPSDLDLPQEEEPTEPETEDTYTPIPVYPTVEPDVDIPEPIEEEYTPLPVYPIVEPEIEE